MLWELSSASATPIGTLIVKLALAETARLDKPPEPALSDGSFHFKGQNMYTDQDDTTHSPPAKASAQQELESMRRCPKFDSCNATICPMDPNWRSRDVLSRDATCTWLLEMARGGPEAPCVPEQIRLQVSTALPAILSSVGMGNLRSAMNRAAKSSSRRDPANLANLRMQEAA